MLYLFLLGTLVFQQGDTLKFMQNDTLLDQWFLGEEKKDETIYIKRAKVAANNKYFFLYEEKFYPDKEDAFTKITYYNATRTKLWGKTIRGARRVSWELTRLFDDKLILITTNRYYGAPSLYIIKNRKMQQIIKADTWQGIVNYEVSPNFRYIALHTKNPYNNKPWDYIGCIDLKTMKQWSYLFPVCLSCKRAKIDLNVNDDGIIEVIHKNEHRVFSKDGTLMDVYLKVD